MTLLRKVGYFSGSKYLLKLRGQKVPPESVGVFLASVTTPCLSFFSPCSARAIAVRSSSSFSSSSSSSRGRKKERKRESEGKEIGEKGSSCGFSLWLAGNERRAARKRNAGRSLEQNDDVGAVCGRDRGEKETKATRSSLDCVCTPLILGGGGSYQSHIC